MILHLYKKTNQYLCWKKGTWTPKLTVFNLSLLFEFLDTDSQNAYIFYNTGIYNSITIQKAYLSLRYPKIWNTSIEKSYHIHTLQLIKDLEYILF